MDKALRRKCFMNLRMYDNIHTMYVRGNFLFIFNNHATQIRLLFKYDRRRPSSRS